MDDNKNPELEENQTGSVTQQTTEPKLSKFAQLKSRKFWLVILPMVLLVAGLGWLGYEYRQNASRINELSQEVSTLEQTVADKDQRIAQLQSEDGGNAGETPADPCSSGSTYTADVGNFTIALDDPYVIIRDLDAGFEGGPATRLSLASCIDGETNVFDSPFQRDVNILANPQVSAENLRTSYESQNGTLTADGTTDVGGVTANKYTLDTLFETTVLFFDRESIGYQIEASGTPSQFNPLLNDLTEDWEFDS